MEAFNATLEEAALSDFLIHVLDASQPEVMEFYNTTMSVLTDLGADTKQMLVVFNKVDKVSDPSSALRCAEAFSRCGRLRGTGEGMDELIERISEFVARGTMTVELQLPAGTARSDWRDCIGMGPCTRYVTEEHDFPPMSSRLSPDAIARRFLRHSFPGPFDWNN